MQFSLLEEFVELANCLSFSKAASRLHVSQPTLSVHVHKLEKEAGAVLISRDRPISLTPAGEEMYDAAVKILAIRSEALEKCRSIGSSDLSGFLAIKTDYVHAEVRSLFLRSVMSFRRLHPLVRVSLAPEYTVEVDLADGPLDGKANVWFLSTSFNESLEDYMASSAAESLLVSKSQLTLWMDPSNPLAQKSRVSVEDIALNTYPMPMGPRFAELRAAAEDVLGFCNVNPPRRSVLARSLEEYVLKMEPDYAFLMIDGHIDPREFGLVSRPFDPPIEHRNYLMVRTEEENPAAKAFLEYIRNVFLDSAGALG